MKTRVFTCNAEDFPYREVVNEINRTKKNLRDGFTKPSGWTCSKIQSIRVGETAYFYRVGQQPLGFFARGRIVAEESRRQLRQQRPEEFKYLSATYSYQDTYNDYSKEEIIEERMLAITYEWDSVVDYDRPLLGSDLKGRAEFNYYKFLFRQSGQAFSDEFKEQHLRLLYETWNEHVRKMAKRDFGAYLELA